MTYQDLLAAIDTARRAKDAPTVATLVTLQADIQAVSKKALRDPSDDDTLAQAKTTVKQLDTLLNGDPTTNLPPLPDSVYRQQTQAKRDLLASYLPQPLSGEALAQAIREVADGNDVPITPQNIGKIMPLLIAKYGKANIDGASVKAALAAGV